MVRKSYGLQGAAWERQMVEQVDKTSPIRGTAVIENVLGEHSVGLSGWALPGKTGHPAKGISILSMT